LLSEIVINMLVHKFAAGLAVLAVLFSFSHVAPALAGEASQKADVVGTASSPSRKSPINVKVVDYQRAEEGPGTLKMSGLAIGGQDIFISVDDKPFAQVTVADDGSWSVEDKIALDDTVHSVRMQQLDKTTQMPAATVMFSMKLSPPTPEDLSAPPPRQ
jgi:hypothetical protein